MKEAFKLNNKTTTNNSFPLEKILKSIIKITTTFFFLLISFLLIYNNK
jgi:hypothetical protein